MIAGSDGGAVCDDISRIDHKVPKGIGRDELRCKMIGPAQLLHRFEIAQLDASFFRRQGAKSLSRLGVFGARQEFGGVCLLSRIEGKIGTKRRLMRCCALGGLVGDTV